VSDSLLHGLREALAPGLEIERELGGGGMARVFVAREVALDRRVVVKVLPPELASGVSVERFRREIQLAARLRHPHVVPLLAAGQVRLEREGDSVSLLYYTMPFVEGESLRARLERTGELPVTEAVRVLREITRGVAHAHRHGVIHRDLKPENVLLDDDAALVADFGIARAIDAARGDDGREAATITTAGMTVGTPAYMAPEAVTGEAVDARADLYALGVIAYEVLAGSHPFVGRSGPAMLAAHATAAPESLTRRRPSVPAALEALVNRLLEKRAADRPQSAAEVLRALEAMAVSDPSLPARFGAGIASRASSHRAAYVVAGALLLAALGALAWGVRRGEGTAPPTPAPTAAERTVAVLGFRNLDADSTNDYFAAGLSEELLNALTNVDGLRVRSALQLRDEQDPLVVGRRLGADAVLGVAVRKGGGRLRVSARLTNVATGDALWAQSYDRELKDVFAVQQELAAAIAAALRLELTPAQAAAARGTDDLEAYDLYLRGRYLWSLRTREATERAAQYFEKALSRDPAYARAYSGLADSYTSFSSFYGLVPSLARARTAENARKALALDSTLAEPYASTAWIRIFYDWDWPGAEAALRRSIALNPSYATAHLWYGWMLMARGRPDESIAALRRARDAEPLSLIINARLGTMLYYARRYDEAVTQLRATFELEGGYWLAHRQLGETYLAMGRHDEAIRELERAVALAPTATENALRLAAAHARVGDRERATAVLRDAARGRPGEYVSPIELARVHLALGDRERAIAEISRGLADHSTNVILLGMDPMFDPLRGEPRFDAMLRRVGLVPVGRDQSVRQ
jgi:eukaryotic-like serine/threonine-protein kinase